jgi:type IV secretion system protein VirB1
MDTITFQALVLACAPLVHPVTAQALVTVESRFNPHAIGVVGGALDRQPRNRAEALATARQLAAAGWDFSVGLAQINQRNFERLGLTMATAFEPCDNLRAMQAVLTECLQRTAPAAAAQVALRQTLSCYYSGDLARGIRLGYVGKVVRAASPPRVTPSAAP